MEEVPFSEANFRILLALVKKQSEEIAYLTEENVYLKSKIKELEGRLNMNSSNSSKPPSSDGFKKRITNLRKQSGKKPGGQPGHEGSTLQMVSTPDEVIIHAPQDTCRCGCGLNAWESLPVEVGQIIDIPPVKAKVIEHRKTGFRCKACGDAFMGDFPLEVCVDRILYGFNIQSLAVYFNQYHFIPYHRLTEMFSDCFGICLSVGTLVNFMKRTHTKLALFEDRLREVLLASPVLHSDETGVRCEGKTQWTHTVSDGQHTYYQIDIHRGTQAMDKAGLLPRYEGYLVHDRYASYFQYDQMEHSLCNAHLLRELKYLHEEEGCLWAEEMMDLLLRAKKHKEENTSVSQRYKTRIENEFTSRIKTQLKKEEKRMEALPDKPVCRGKPKRSKAHNLLLALSKHQQAVLAFIMHQHVPFDNNQAERDLRMIKTKQKVSGCFRSQDGGSIFCRIRSYLSTLKKNQQNILRGIQDMLIGSPFIPCSIAE